jgi:hypothetical protein
MVRIYSPERTLETYEAGPFRMNLRQLATDRPGEKPMYEIVVWDGWVVWRHENIIGIYDARYRFEAMKQDIAVEIAKRAMGVTQSPCKSVM